MKKVKIIDDKKSLFDMKNLERFLLDAILVNPPIGEKNDTRTNQ